MKSIIMHLTSLMLLISFTTSCGKKSDSGGSKQPANSNAVTPPVVVPTTPGQISYAKALAWYKGNDAMPVGGHGAYTIKTGTSDFYFDKSLCTSSLFNALCEKPTQCYIKTSNGTMNGVVMMSGSQGLHYDGCNISVINQYVRSEDIELKNAILGKSGSFLLQELTQESGNIITIFYGAYAGSNFPIAWYRINTSIPHILNPIVSRETVSNAIQEKRTIYQIYQ